MFLTIILSFLDNVFKTFLFLDRQNLGLFGTQTYTRGMDFLPGKKYFEPPSFSPSSTMFSKNFSFLDRQNLGLFGTQTYARGIDFLLSKKNKKLRPWYGMECMVKDLFSIQLRGRENIKE